MGDQALEEEKWSASRNVVEAARKRTRELEAALASAREDVVQLRSRASEIIGENEELHAKLERDAASVTPQQQGGKPEQLGESAAEYVRELEERVEILSGENGLLAEEASALQAETQRLGRELSKSEAERLKLKEELDLELKRSKEKDVDLVKEKEARAMSVKRFLEKGKECASLENSKRELEASALEMQKQMDTLRDQSEEKSVALLELGKRLEVEGDDMWSKVQASVSRARELQETAAAAVNELETVKEKMRSEKRELESCKSDNAGMVKVMSTMERALAKYAYREAEVANATKDAKETAELALSDRDAARVRLEVVLRDLAFERERRQLESSELAVALENGSKKEKEKFRQILAKKDEEIAEHLKKMTLMNFRAEESDRKKQAAELLAQKFQRTLEDLNATLECDIFRNFAKNIDDANNKLKIAPEEKKQVSSLPLLLETGVEELEEDLRAALAEAASAQSKARDLQASLIAKDKELKRLQKNADEEKNDLQKKLSESSRETEERAVRLAAALANARQANDQANATILAQADRHKNDLEKLVILKDAATNDALTRLREERRVVNRLSNYDQDLEKQLATVLADLAATQHQANSLQSANDIAQRRCQTLSAQLARSLKTQDDLIAKSSKRNIQEHTLFSDGAEQQHTLLASS